MNGQWRKAAPPAGGERNARKVNAAARVVGALLVVTHAASVVADLGDEAHFCNGLGLPRSRKHVADFNDVVPSFAALKTTSPNAFAVRAPDDRAPVPIDLLPAASFRVFTSLPVTGPAGAPSGAGVEVRKCLRLVGLQAATAFSSIALASAAVPDWPCTIPAVDSVRARPASALLRSMGLFLQASG